MTAMQDPEQVRRWVSEAEAEVARLTDESERVGRQLADARRRVTLLHEILAAVTNSPDAIQTDVELLSTRERVIRNTERILRDAKAPMRIGDIHAEFIRRGYPLPGRGSPTNLVAHLGQSHRIARLGRGVYALPAADGADGGATEPEDTPER